MEDITEMLKGILEGCILEIINRKNTYGYEITRKLNEFGFKDVVEGTVYTILIRFEKNKLVDIQKKRSELGPPRKFIRLMIKGVRSYECFGKNGSFCHQK
ncbi:transcriptional regulator PadR family protein [Candidatus Arthromitus sp. SFB-1]|nr:transcriptional regulator PadR family protein [Candidatus Arthromitus sp. SFB-1]